MSEDDPDAERSAEVPLSELRRRLEERRGRPTGSASDGGPTDGSPFEAVDVEPVDGEVLWDAVVDGTAEPSGPSSETDDAGDGAAPTAEVHVVDKRECCQRCRFFAAPPAVGCEREGTEIVEVVDGDRFRVRGCPMVDDDGGWRSRLADDHD